MNAPAPTSPDASALLATGIPITLADGTVVHLRYTMLSVARLEANFGSLAGVMKGIQSAAIALEQSMSDDAPTAPTSDTGSLFTVLIQALAPGLLDAEATDPRSGEVVWLGEHEDVVGRLLAFDQFGEYLQAFGASFAQAFRGLGGANPPQEVEQEAPAPARPSSRGRTGGTSRSGKPAAARTSSGA